MKKGICMLTLFLCLASGTVAGQEQTIVIHFFSSALCPVCKKAADDIGRLSAPGKKLKIIRYQLSDRNGKIDIKNLRVLTTKLRAIDTSIRGQPFIVHQGKKYSFHEEKGMPFYLKRISATRVLKKEIPVPFFIIRDSAYIGYNRSILQRKINRLSR